MPYHIPGRDLYDNPNKYSNSKYTRMDLHMSNKETIGIIIYSVGCIIVAVSLGELLRFIY